MSDTPRILRVQEQQVRTFIDWTPELTRSALLMADGGTLRMAADLWEAIRRDGRVSGVLSTRVLGMLGLPISFPVNGDKRRAAGIEKAFTEDFHFAYPEEELAQLISWGLGLGVGLGEQVWTQREDRLVPVLKTWHPRWLRFDWTLRQWFLTVNEGTEIQIAPGDGKWILFTPYGGLRPWAWGLWVQLAPPWLAKKYAGQDWASYSQAHGQPTKVGFTPEGAGQDVRDAVASDFASMGGATTIALPKGYDFKLVEATARTWETFQAQRSEANTDIAITIVGQNLTTEVKEGSRAAATVHSTVKQDLIEFDTSGVGTCLSTQSTPWWAEYNFGDRRLAPVPTWDPTPPEDVKLKNEASLNESQALVALGTATALLRAQGIELDLETILERRNIPATAVEPTPTAAPSPGALQALALSSAAKADGYIERLGSVGRQMGAELLGKDIEKLTALIEQASSFEEVLGHLPLVFAHLNPEELAALLQNVIVLGTLSGMKTMTQETAP